MNLPIRWLGVGVLCLGVGGCDDNLPNTDHLKAPLIEAPAEAFRRPAQQADPLAGLTIVQRTRTASNTADPQADATASPSVLGPVKAPKEAHMPLRGTLQPVPGQAAKLLIRSLADGEALTLGLDAAQRPATATLLSEKGEFEVFLPRTSPGLIGVEMNAAATAGVPLNYQALIELPPKGPVPLSDETALLSRVWRAQAQSTLAALAQAPNETAWLAWEMLDTAALERLTRAHNELSDALKAPALRAGQPAALQRAGDALLSRWQPSQALISREALGSSRVGARQADPLLGAPWLATLQRVLGLLEARAGEVLKLEPGFARERPWLLGAAQKDPPANPRALADYVLESLAFGTDTQAENLLLLCLADMRPPTDPETGLPLALTLQVLRSEGTLSLARLITDDAELWRTVLARLTPPRR